MMSEEYYTTNLKKLNIEKHETIGGLDLPKGRELKEEVIENSQKITTQQKWYRWRADKLSAAAAAARRSTKVGGGGAHKLSAAAAWRGRRTALYRAGRLTHDPSDDNISSTLPMIHHAPQYIYIYIYCNVPLTRH